MNKLGNIIMISGILLLLLFVIDLKLINSNTLGLGNIIFGIILLVIGSTLQQSYDESHCLSCKDGKQIFVDEIIVNSENLKKKVVDREYTNDMDGNKLSQ